jgi:hypothetical protein
MLVTLNSTPFRITVGPGCVRNAMKPRPPHASTMRSPRKIFRQALHPKAMQIDGAKLRGEDSPPSLRASHPPF